MRSMNITRRSALCGLGAAALAPWARGRAQPSSLAELGRVKGIEIGAAFDPLSGDDASPAAELIRRHCHIMVPEFSIKRSFLKEFGCRRAFAFRDFAGRHRKRMHGHALYWPIRDDVVEPAESLTAKQARYRSWFETLIDLLPGATSWDVLNEVILQENAGVHGGHIRDRTLPEGDRLAFLSFCLKSAREILGREVRLVINDYNLYCSFPACQPKRDAMLRVLRALLDDGAPLDAVGIQSHLSTNAKSPFEAVAAFIEQLARLDLKVHISELDMMNLPKGRSTTEIDRSHASLIEEYLSTVLDNPAVERLTFWRLSDLNHHNIGRNDHPCEGKCVRPTLFDEEFKQKPVFGAVVRALDAAPVRPWPAALTTSGSPDREIQCPV